MPEALQPWYAIATPHKDIREGRLEEAVFAANIWAVVQRTAPEVYLDPEEFFRKTYMTVGLGAILARVAEALRSGEAGDRIISLQTSFGGGKTHTLVALWHLAKHAERLRTSPAAAELRRVLGDRFPEQLCNTAVFTNATCDSTQGRETPEGVRTHTLWGELALQLGGRTLYEKIRANDETQRVPQGLFVEVLSAASPCLILLDELADYCVGAAAVPVGDTTLADQTISFIQQLTEAVQQVPGAVVVATLPASKYEVAQSEKGQEAFATLERRFQRLGADIKPVADDEIYQVVRTRLFESVTRPEDSEYPTKVAAAYQDLYASHAAEVPTEAARSAYRGEIERSYPFHPLVIDALYTRWGSHPDFQRTRGVLRLLASVVGDLWDRRETNTQSQPLIQPCHIRWSLDPLQAALTRLWGPGYQSVAAADIVSDKSNAGVFDDERGGDYRRERIGQGLAAAMLLGSFGGQGHRTGFSAKELKLACSRPSLNWSYSDGALLELENRCFYLHYTAAGSPGKRYWFNTRPTLNKLVVQYRQQAAREAFEPDILSALEEHAGTDVRGGATWRVIVNPDSDLPEQRGLALLILPPTLSWGDDDASQAAVKRRVSESSQRCGGKERHYRNTLLFLAPTTRGLSKLASAYRERAALRGVKSDYGDQLEEEQQQDLRQRLQTAEKAAAEALGPAYTIALRMDGQDVEAVSLGDARPSFPDHLAYVWESLVDEEEWILRRVGSVTLRDAGLIPETGGIQLKDAIEAFLRFTDKPAIATKDGVILGIAQACVDGQLGIARGPSLSSLHAQYCRRSVPLDPTEEGLWIIPPFQEAPVQPVTTTTTANGGTVPNTTTTSDGENRFPPNTNGDDEVKEDGIQHLARQIRIQGTVPPESWAELFRCFVNPAVRMNLKRLNLGIRFELEAGPDARLSADDPSIKAMQEAARQLGLSLDVEE